MICLLLSKVNLKKNKQHVHSSLWVKNYSVHSIFDYKGIETLDILGYGILEVLELYS